MYKFKRCYKNKLTVGDSLIKVVSFTIPVKPYIPALLNFSYHQTYLFTTKNKITMKFMLHWRLHQEKRKDVLKGFSSMTAADDANDLGDKIRMIGRWHDVTGGTGVVIVESDDATAISNWALNWNPFMDITITPVLDDEETRAVGRARK